jgi:hypothetical protein
MATKGVPKRGFLHVDPKAGPRIRVPPRCLISGIQSCILKRIPQDGPPIGFCQRVSPKGGLTKGCSNGGTLKLGPRWGPPRAFQQMWPQGVFPKGFHTMGSPKERRRRRITEGGPQRGVSKWSPSGGSRSGVANGSPQSGGPQRGYPILVQLGGSSSALSMVCIQSYIPM